MRLALAAVVGLLLTPGWANAQSPPDYDGSVDLLLLSLRTLASEKVAAAEERRRLIALHHDEWGPCVGDGLGNEQERHRQLGLEIARLRPQALVAFGERGDSLKAALAAKENERREIEQTACGEQPWTLDREQELERRPEERAAAAGDFTTRELRSAAHRAIMFCDEPPRVLLEDGGGSRSRWLARYPEPEREALTARCEEILAAARAAEVGHPWRSAWPDGV